MSRILAIDTATDACSAALWIDAALTQREALAPRAHADLILPMVDGLLRDAGLELRALDAIAFGRGPGSFTGVRIASSVAQGLAFGSDRPVLAISDLAALARRAWREHGARRVLCALDARMGEVYAAAYDLDAQGAPTLLGAEQVAAPDALPRCAGGAWYGAGSGWAAHGAALATRIPDGAVGVDAAALPSAQDVAALGAAAFAAGAARPARAALPVYLRDRVAEPQSR